MKRFQIESVRKLTDLRRQAKRIKRISIYALAQEKRAVKPLSLRVSTLTQI